MELLVKMPWTNGLPIYSFLVLLDYWSNGHAWKDIGIDLLFTNVSWFVAYFFLFFVFLVIKHLLLSTLCLFVHPWKLKWGTDANNMNIPESHYPACSCWYCNCRSVLEQSGCLLVRNLTIETFNIEQLRYKRYMSVIRNTMLFRY